MQFKASFDNCSRTIYEHRRRLLSDRLFPPTIVRLATLSTALSVAQLAGSRDPRCHDRRRYCAVKRDLTSNAAVAFFNSKRAPARRVIASYFIVAKYIFQRKKRISAWRQPRVGEGTNDVPRARNRAIAAEVFG